MKQLQSIISYLDGCRDRVDLEHLERLLRETPLRRQDVQDVCEFSRDTYHRNLVSKSEWYEMLVMCWRSGQHSQIHDHRGSSCAFKVIEGVAAEDIYELASPGKVRYVASRNYLRDDVCVAQTSDIHQILNREGGDLITLHIYSPPLQMTTYERIIETSDQPTA